MLFIKSVIASSQGKTWGCFSQFCLGRSRPHRGISEYWTTQCQDWQDGADVEICHSSLSNHNLYYWTCNLSSGSLSTTNSTLIKTMSIEYHCHNWYHHHQGIQICFIQHCWKMQSFIKKLKLKKRREPIKSHDDSLAVLTCHSGWYDRCYKLRVFIKDRSWHSQEDHRNCEESGRRQIWGPSWIPWYPWKDSAHASSAGQTGVSGRKLRR